MSSPVHVGVLKTCPETTPDQKALFNALQLPEPPRILKVQTAKNRISWTHTFEPPIATSPFPGRFAL